MLTNPTFNLNTLIFSPPDASPTFSLETLSFFLVDASPIVSLNTLIFSHLMLTLPLV